MGSDGARSERNPPSPPSIEGGEVPATFGIESVSPNPFNNSTTVCFTVPFGSESAQSAKSAVRLTLHDLTGREVQRLVDDRLAPGGYSLSLNGSNFSPGLYFLRLRIAEQQSTQKLVLLK